MKNRVSARNGRTTLKGETFSAKHNDRTGGVGEHIDLKREKTNTYWNCLGDEKKNFEQVELEVYRELFGESLEKKNIRYREKGHPEKQRTIEEVVKGKRTAPLESIYQLGNKENLEELEKLVGSKAMAREVMRQVLWDAIINLVEYIKPYSKNMRLLNLAAHLDETTPHIHARQCFFYVNERGERVLGQEKALKKMGFELPDPEKPEGRFNNRLMTFSAYMRDAWIKALQTSLVTFKEENPQLEQVAEYLLQMELEPQKGKKHIEKNDYIIQKQKEMMKKQEEDLENGKRQKADLEKEIANLERKKSKDARLIEYEKAFLSFVNEAEAEAERERARGRGRGR